MSSAAPTHPPRWELGVLDMAGTTIADGGIVHAAVAAAVEEVAPGTPIDLDVVRRFRGGRPPIIDSVADLPALLSATTPGDTSRR